MKIFDKYLSREIGLGKKCADMLGVSTAAVSQVRSGDRPMPIDWMEKIEKFTNRRLTVDQMAREASRLRRKTRRGKTARDEQ